MTYETVSANQVTPPHGVRDEAKLQTIIASMESDGWSGRPVMVFDDAEGQYKALTGSHRIAAAIAAGMPIPVAIISDEDCAAIIDDWEGANDDYDREQVLRDAGLVDAADLMSAEICANEAEWI
jgi:ParB-like chromosome segregation protein Spo0J